jgi:hypothetical protein
VARPFNEPGSGYSSSLGAAVFLGFVAAGCVYIITAKLSGIGPLYVTFVPIGGMLLYALTITLARRLRLRDDQSGDNLYYMGFLFTLTSLGASLYQFSATNAAEEIVQNFGIAIGSTIAGIGLRVILNQMRRDPIEVERMMRLELAEAARRVRRELDSSVVEFGYFRRSAQQSAVDSFKAMNESFDAQLTRFFARLDEVAKAVAGPVEAASRKSGAAIGAMSETIGTALATGAGQLSGDVEKLSGRMALVATALEQVTAGLDAMQTPERVIDVRLEPVAQILTQAVEKLTAHADAQTRAMKEVFAHAGAQAQRSADAIALLRDKLDAPNSADRAAVESAVTMISATSEVLDEIRESSRSYAATLAAMLQRTDETMRTFTEVLIQSGTESMARTDRLSELLPVIEAKLQALALAAERMSAMTELFVDGRMRPKPETVD